MVIRFILYGFLGWILEIIFTGSGSLLRGSISLTGYTYLWMFPIYGLAVFLEPIHDGIRKAPWPIRGLIWAALILVIEYLSGWILIQLIGFCPWDYTGSSPYAVDGLIRLDFSPFCLVAGLIFERIHDSLDQLGFPHSAIVQLKPLTKGSEVKKEALINNQGFDNKENH
jgi:uncharacterized membrane protein